MSSPVLTAADDSFHTPASGDPWWTETSWHSFWVPERRLSGALYAFFRPNLGVCNVGVYLWDDAACLPWEVVYSRHLWHLPMPADLTAMTLVGGLSYERLEPLRRYRLGYADSPELELYLVYEALLQPHVVGGAHLDQPGRVTGSLVLRGERIEVDCLAMRDRSWSVRPDIGSMRAGYAYATASGASAFHVITITGDEEQPVVGGYLVRDGVLADLVSGSRRVVDRDAAGHPARVAVSARDAVGRALEAEGRCVNRLAFWSSSNSLAWMSLTAWSFDQAVVWGEDQDIWSPGAWRAFAAGRRE